MVVIALECGAARLTFQPVGPDPSWVALRVGVADHERLVGHDSLGVLAARLRAALRGPPGEPSGTIEGQQVEWVLNTADPCGTLYLHRTADRLVLHFQLCDASGSVAETVSFPLARDEASAWSDRLQALAADEGE